MPLSPEDRAHMLATLRANKDRLPPRIAAAIEEAPTFVKDPSNPWAKPEGGRSVAIAALFILRCSYGQIMALFGVSQSTVYSAVVRYLPQAARSIRGRGAGKPLIPYELATQYYQLLSRAGTYHNAIQLAAKLQSMANQPEERDDETGNDRIGDTLGTSLGGDAKKNQVEGEPGGKDGAAGD